MQVFIPPRSVEQKILLSLHLGKRRLPGGHHPAYDRVSAAAALDELDAASGVERQEDELIRLRPELYALHDESLLRLHVNAVEFVTIDPVRRRGLRRYFDR